ncbi:hypothetical protein ACFWU5_08130 [Nocardia sp. NPDC058640]|uniref:hypothetical protein n=1 Tax=Nocardia sp. NPDC058640 TaxID=3346571 RepID=UPI0036466FEB
MKYKSFTAAALLTVAMLGVAGGTSYADPASAPTYKNVDQGVAYEVSQTQHGGVTSLIAKLDGGTFVRTADSIAVVDGAGKQIAGLPLTVEFDGGEVALQPQVSENGKVLTADPIGTWRTTSPKSRSTETGASIGSALGGIAGLIVGIAIGAATMGLLLPITVPVGLIVGILGGAAIGGVLGASIPNSDVPDRREYTPTCYQGYRHTYCY